MTTGTACMRGSVLICLSTSKPSITGMMWSRKITSGSVVARYLKASAAESAVSTR